MNEAMNETFWSLWKALVPILAIIIVGLLVDRYQEERRAEKLEQELANANQRRADLVRKLAEAQIDAAEAQSVANILRHRDAATCPCSEVKANREEIARLHDSNQKLIVDALVNNTAKYIKINRN